MKKQLILLPSLIAAAVAGAQNAPPPPENEKIEEVVVTGSRIVQSAINSQAPISIIDRAAIERTGLASIGDLLQQVTAGGKALNAKFNSSGNFGYPADGGGIGAGSAQVDLRNLSSKRVLVLVDGIRWVNESSASGVSGAADLNTIPMSIIDRVEVLEDGASAIYGSDAIAGVVNIITRKNYEGVEVNAYHGEYELGGRPPTPVSRSAAAARSSTVSSSPATTIRKRSARVNGINLPFRNPRRVSRRAAPRCRRAATRSAIRRVPPATPASAVIRTSGSTSP